LYPLSNRLAFAEVYRRETLVNDRGPTSFLAIASGKGSASTLSDTDRFEGRT
jgi:hypothetical protein